MKENEIEVKETIHAPIEKVWNYYTDPDHITQWAFASDDWEAPHAENDVSVGGKFLTRMAAKDKSAEFDFTGTYTAVREHELLAYTLEDGRTVTVHFEPSDDGVLITTVFEMETENPKDMQQEGWQAILTNFKKHVESQ